MPNHILVACMPKSASTFVTNALAHAAGLTRVTLAPAFGRRDQELCELCLIEHDGADYIAQQHIKNSDWTQKLCDRHDISVVVLLRSLFDVVVSLRDHVHRESVEAPMFYLESRHLQRSAEDLEQMIALMAIPWYVNFYLGWRNSEGARMFLYEDFVADPHAALTEMLEHSGIAADPERIQAGIAAARGAGSRVNVGKAGRGADLRPRTVNLILDMLRCYPEIADDRYVQMMRAQAEGILAAGSQPAAVAARPRPPVSRPSLVQRIRQDVRRRLRKRGRTADGILAIGLLAVACAYYAFCNELVPDVLPGGRFDQFLVPAALVFVAARLLTRTKVRFTGQPVGAGRG